jgi:hypothetical protein
MLARVGQIRISITDRIACCLRSAKNAEGSSPPYPIVKILSSIGPSGPPLLGGNVVTRYTVRLNDPITDIRTLRHGCRSWESKWGRRVPHYKH